MKLKQILGFLLALAIGSCGSNHGSPDPVLALTGVSVVDVEAGEIATDQTILIQKGQIAYVGSEPSAESLSAATVVDHSGRYVIPGLWDMHIHLRNGDGADLSEENAKWLRQYLAYGVTTVRDAGGDLPDAVLSWRAEIERGERMGPRIFTSLQKLDGATGGWAGSLRLSTADDIGPALESLQTAGADFVKLYDGSISDELYLAAIAEAERRGLRTAGHLPLTIAFEDAINAGLDSVEHELYLAKAASAVEAEVSADIIRANNSGENWSFYGMLELLQSSVDEDKLDRVLDRMIARNAALTPTLHVGQVLDQMTSAAAHDNDERLAQVPPGIRESFALRLDSLIERAPETVARDIAVTAANWRFLKTAADKGVVILAGSDTGAVNSYLYPGDSLHHELAKLVEAGLTTLQALQAATIHASKWMGQTDSLGSVDVGKIADLIILDRNPLEDIANTRTIVAVVQEGRYLNETELAELSALSP